MCERVNNVKYIANPKKSILLHSSLFCTALSNVYPAMKLPRAVFVFEYTAGLSWSKALASASR